MLGKHKSYKIMSCISLLYFICYGCIGFNFLFLKMKFVDLKKYMLAKTSGICQLITVILQLVTTEVTCKKGHIFLTIPGCDLHKINCPNEVHVQKQSLTYVFSFKWKLFNLQVTVCQSFFFLSD